MAGQRGAEFHVRAGWLIAAVWFGLWTAGAANAGGQRVYEIDLPTQSVAEALNALSEQTGVPVVFPYDLVSKCAARAVLGRYTLQGALAALLAGTGLSGGLTDKGVLTVSPSKPGARNCGETNVSQNDNRAQNLEPTKSGLAKIGAFFAALAATFNASGQDVVDQAQGALEEIVVTAQKREERLQNVPISVSVLTGESLDRSSLEGVTEALTLVPGAKVTVGSQGGGTQVSLRGVSAGGPLFNGSSTVAYYMDSVPFGFVKTAAVPDANAYDMERIEVLRGPQGTLYGAGALNGVIRLLSREADPSDFEFKARTTASMVEGGDASYRGDLALNLPIVEDRFAARVVLGYNELGGWIDRPGFRDANSGEVTNARIRLNATPTENLSIGFMAWTSESEFDATPTGFQDQTNSLAALEPYSTEYDIYGLQVDYDFGPFSVSSRTSFVEFANEGILAPAPATFFLTTNLVSEVTSEELLLTSNGEGAWRYSAGLFYRDAEDRLFQDIPGVVTVYSGNYSESYAVFGELTRVLAGDAFEITGGLRYFNDDVTQIEFINSTGPRGEIYEKVTPRLILKWHPSVDTTLYASYSEGFRSGFTQSSLVLARDPTFPPLAEDTLTNYEVGIKGSLFARDLRYEVAAYYIDWQDVQQTVFVQVQAQPTIFATAAVNGESASGAGLDAAVMLNVTDNLTLGLSASWNDLVFDDDVISRDVVFFSAGERLNFSSEQTLGASAEYEFSLGGGYLARLTGLASYSSAQDNRSQSNTTGAVTINRGDDILITRATFAIEAPKNWGLALFVDNANDEDGTPSANSDPRQSSRVRPRTFGVQFEYSFGK